ncbi:MAG: DUF6502 family protein [Burkholderiaceae bacterium]|nr:DUF6502 family protein [Burkholderiaceae bacterium]
MSSVPAHLPASGETSAADLLLRHSVDLWMPWIRLLVAHGVTYPMLAQALKGAFLLAARDELQARGGRQTDSALSLLSGVHRKDVRALGHARRGEGAEEGRRSLAASVIARWLADPAYRDADGQPLALPLRGTGPDACSFERLCNSVSKDFHPRAILDELIRLGAATADRSRVRMTAPSRAALATLAQALGTLTENLREHVTAAAANLAAAARGEPPPYLDQAVAVRASGPECARAVQATARRAGQSALEEVRATGEAPSSADGEGFRIRFGVFCVAQPMPGAPPFAARSAIAAPARARPSPGALAEAGPPRPSVSSG